MTMRKRTVNPLEPSRAADIIAAIRKVQSTKPKRGPREGKRGPRAWVPSKEERLLVEHYVSIGMTQDHIALVMQKSVDSLQRHCRHELDTGTLKANAVVGASLFERASIRGDTTAQIFWMKTRAGWKERAVVELTGEDGGAIITSEMTPKEAAEKYREKLG
jgi:hypothetical protein